MSDRPRVTIVIPCYNSAAYVEEAVASALGQTYGPVDVVVVNDGSTDDFEHAVAPFRSQVRILTQPNSGQAAARNLGLAQVESELVAFLDADDRWLPRKIEKQVALLASRPDVALVHTGVSPIDETGRPCGRVLRGDRGTAVGYCLVELTTANRITASSVLLRRSALRDELFRLGIDGVEDWDLWLRLAAKHSFAFIDEPLTEYRLHNTNTSLSHERMLTGSVRVLDRLLETLPSREVARAARRHRRQLIGALGHLEYERGNARAARQCLAAAFPAWTSSEAVRWSATFLPDGVRGMARAAWQRVQR